MICIITINMHDIEFTAMLFQDGMIMFLSHRLHHFAKSLHGALFETVRCRNSHHLQLTLPSKTIVFPHLS